MTPLPPKLSVVAFIIISPPIFSVASARKLEIIVFPAWLGPTTATFTVYIVKLEIRIGNLEGKEVVPGRALQ